VLGACDVIDEAASFRSRELDEFGDGDAMARFVATLPEPKTLVVVPGSDHFFTEKTDALGAAVSEWLELI
jgi:alpha/beta superfamily hydrolase